MIPPLEHLKTLLARPDAPALDYLVEAFLARGCLSVLAGDPKAGKSTLLRNLQLSVARGTPFLHRKCIPSTIVYYALEEPPAHVLGEFSLLGAKEESIYIRMGSIDKRLLLPLLEQDIVDVGASMAVIDPLFDALSVADLNAYSQMNDALKVLQRTARRTNCHILAVHHTNKGQNVSAGRGILGSQAIAGSTECNMFLSKKQNGVRVFSSENRVGDPIEPLLLDFDRDTRIIRPEGTIGQTKIEQVKPLLLACLEEHGPLSTTELRGRVRGRHNDKAIALEEMQRDGLVTSTQKGKQVTWDIVRVPPLQLLSSSSS